MKTTIIALLLSLLTCGCKTTTSLSLEGNLAKQDAHYVAKVEFTR